MYIGRYYHQLEEKGRVTLPKKFRSVEQMIITRGLDGGLYLYPLTQWDKKINELLLNSDTKKNNRDYIRLMTNDAQEIVPDQLGRIKIPEYLIEFASLSKQVVIVGSYTKIEIWDVEKYHQYLDEIEKNMEDIAEKY